jgi:MoaA/NifB/PqqE/SkfB family radical SAM enzyme
MPAPRVLVVHPPVSIARDFIDYPYFSDLGAVQLAAVLEQRLGPAQVALVDAHAQPNSGLHWRPDGRARLGVDPADLLVALTGDDPAAVVVAYTPFHRPPRRDDLLAAVLSDIRARWPAAALILAECYQSGQHHITFAGDEVLRSYPEADALVLFEAERTVPALIDALFTRGERPRGVHRGEQPELDELPPPAWHRLELGALARFHARVVAGLGRSPWAFPIDGHTLPLVTSRGCPFRCLHCSSNPDTAPGEPKRQRRRSPENLSALLERYRELGATRLYVLDELVNVHEGHFDHLLAELHRLDLRLEIPNGMRADYLEPRHLALLAGRITTVSVSAESGVQRVVTEVVGKRLDLQAIVRAAEAAHAAKVPLMIHYIIGMPGESAAEVNATLAFALDLWDRYQAWPAVQHATPLPGTRLARAGRSLPVLSDSDDGDWGPRFQRAASDLGGVEPELLAKFMWTFEQRLRASQGPRKLIMNVTYVCNNHCTFCAVGTRTQIDGHPTRQREQLDHYRRQGVHQVDFDGGEPTLNPELVPLIRHARALGYDRINVTTNGRLCAYEAFAARLVNSGLTTLLFSIHGPDARTHAQNVGVAEAFEQTVAGVRHCVRLAPAGVALGMNVTITRGNVELLGELAQLAWDLGLPWMNLQFLTPFGRATRQIAPDTAHAAARAAAVIDAWQARMKFQVINLPFCFMPEHARFLQGDLAKLERHMVFVNNESVNLGQYLAERRTRKPQCAPCPHACFCGGFYELDDVPEPPWLIAAEDLVRPIDDPRRHESVPAGFRGRMAARERPES